MYVCMCMYVYMYIYIYVYVYIYIYVRLPLGSLRSMRRSRTPRCGLKNSRKVGPPLHWPYKMTSELFLRISAVAARASLRNQKFSKSRLTTTLPIPNDYRADFWECLPLVRVRSRRRSQRCTRSLRCKQVDLLERQIFFSTNRYLI